MPAVGLDPRRMRPGRPFAGLRLRRARVDARNHLRAFRADDRQGAAPDERMLRDWARSYLDDLPALGGAEPRHRQASAQPGGGRADHAALSERAGAARAPRSGRDLLFGLSSAAQPALDLCAPAAGHRSLLPPRRATRRPLGAGLSGSVPDRAVRGVRPEFPTCRADAGRSLRARLGSAVPGVPAELASGRDPERGRSPRAARRPQHARGTLRGALAPLVAALGVADRPTGD